MKSGSAACVEQVAPRLLLPCSSPAGRQRSARARLDAAAPAAAALRARDLAARRDPPAAPIVAVLPGGETGIARNRGTFCRGAARLPVAGALMEVVDHAPAPAFGALLMQEIEPLRSSRPGAQERCRSRNCHHLQGCAYHAAALSATKLLHASDGRYLAQVPTSLALRRSALSSVLAQPVAARRHVGHATPAALWAKPRLPLTSRLRGA